MNPIFDCISTNIVSGMVMAMIAYYLTSLGTSVHEMGNTFLAFGLGFAISAFIAGNVKEF